MDMGNLVTEAAATDIIGTGTRQWRRHADVQSSQRPALLRRVDLDPAPIESVASSINPVINPMGPARGVLLACMFGGATWLLGGLAVWLLL
jgi:hypothetical protein